MGRVEQKMAEQVAKLQQQLQKVRELGREEVASTEREMNRQLAEERDKSEHLREVLHGTKKVSTLVSGMAVLNFPTYPSPSNQPLLNGPCMHNSYPSYLGSILSLCSSGDHRL